MHLIVFCITVSRLSGHRPATADAVMFSSFHGTSMTASHHEAHNNPSQLLEMTNSLIENFTNDNIMTQSLDPGILAGNCSSNMGTAETSLIHGSSPPTLNNANLYNDQSIIPILQSSGPLQTASKMMPVPEALMSPDCGPPLIVQQRPVSTLILSTAASGPGRNIRYSNQQRGSASVKPERTLKKPDKSSPSNSPRKAIVNTTNTKIHQNQSILKHTTTQPANETQIKMTSATAMDDEDNDANTDSLKSIRKTEQKIQKQFDNSRQLQKTSENKDVEKSAIVIQKLWRGYSTRKKTVRDIAESLQQKRTQENVSWLNQVG
jgi:centrosomal protein CEP97